MKYALPTGIRRSLLLLLLLPAWGLAQTGPGRSFTISGTLVDEQKKPVPFGSVALYQSADSALVTGATSDEGGKFALPARPGRYYLKISILSYGKRPFPTWPWRTPTCRSAPCRCGPAPNCWKKWWCGANGARWNCNSTNASLTWAPT